MTILRWIISHPLLLIFVTLAAVGWFNRDKLGLDAMLAELRSGASSVAAGDAADNAAPAANAAGPQAAAPISSGAESAADRARQRQGGSLPPMSAREAGRPAASGEYSGGGPQEWYDARQAFWDGNYAQSEQRYQAIIMQRPQEPDSYGELGNVYYSRGEWLAAAKMYHQAGLLLAEAGETQRAAGLLGILTALNPNLGDELRERLRQPEAVPAEGGEG